MNPSVLASAISAGVCLAVCVMYAPSVVRECRWRHGDEMRDTLLASGALAWSYLLLTAVRRTIFIAAGRPEWIVQHWSMWGAELLLIASGLAMLAVFWMVRR